MLTAIRTTTSGQQTGPEIGILQILLQWRYKMAHWHSAVPMLKRVFSLGGRGRQHTHTHNQF